MKIIKKVAIISRWRSSQSASKSPSIGRLGVSRGSIGNLGPDGHIKRPSRGLSNLLIRFCCFSIGLYQHCLAPFLPPFCRFQPSCSAYAKEAFAKYGVQKGVLFTLRRLLRCHPWGGSGYDSLP